MRITLPALAKLTLPGVVLQTRQETSAEQVMLVSGLVVQKANCMLMVLQQLVQEVLLIHLLIVS